MVYHSAMHLIKTLLFCFVCLFASQAYADVQLQKQRQLFQQAKKALETNQLNLYQRQLQQLEDYPLQPYLEYLYFRHRLNHVSSKDISRFLEQQQGTFFAERLLTAWLDRLASQKRWSDYVQFYQPHQSDSRQCYYAQALLEIGKQQEAFKLAADLWLVPQSQHKACDPVFSRWKQAGFLTEPLRHQRMMLALRANQFSLANYLAKSTAQTEQDQAWVKRWQDIHKNPHSLLKQLPASPPKNQDQVSLTRDLALSREIIIHGLERLARRSPEQAYKSWLSLKDHYQFSLQDEIQVRTTIGRWAALNRDDKALIYFGNLPGGEWQARAALWVQDWRAVRKAIKQLDEKEANSSRWQYWLGRSQAALGEHAAANATFNGILGERDYYSFLASDHLTQPYAMNDRPLQFTEQEMSAVKQDPAIQRLHEFYAQDMMLEARREAYHLKLNRSDRELQMIATLTHQWGWHNQTIALLGKAKYWDALDLRFPVVFDTAVLKAGKTNGLDPSWVLAIARQESAFNPTARSHAGAMGLMQLMPDTGRLISKLVNRPLKRLSELYHPERNIELGSAYLRRMYDQNQQNPVLATASYNAGPHRVARWLPSEQLDADIWAENIPFNETRHYVQTVMSYAAIFDSQRNQTIKPLSERMPAIKPKTP